MENGERLSESIRDAGAIAAAFIVVARTLSFAWYKYRDRTNKALQKQLCTLRKDHEALKAQVALLANRPRAPNNPSDEL